MLQLVMPAAATVVVDIVAWGAFHTVTGYAAHRLDDARLARDGWLLRPRPFEDGGRWYRRRLRIHRWKDRLPEAGDLFRGGLSKRRLPAYDVEGLRLFARETRRAELGHWWALCCGPVFVLWNPPVAAALLIGYGVVVNLPFIAIQRYNRFRIASVVGRLVDDGADPAGPARSNAGTAIGEELP
jgi:glycosyl-4,4'-diaponeurosporenoate acyltransferase